MPLSAASRPLVRKRSTASPAVHSRRRVMPPAVVVSCDDSTVFGGYCYPRVHAHQDRLTSPRSQCCRVGDHVTELGFGPPCDGRLRPVPHRADEPCIGGSDGVDGDPRDLAGSSRSAVITSTTSLASASSPAFELALEESALSPARSRCSRRARPFERGSVLLVLRAVSRTCRRRAPSSRRRARRRISTGPSSPEQRCRCRGSFCVSTVPPARYQTSPELQLRWRRRGSRGLASAVLGFSSTVCRPARATAAVRAVMVRCLSACVAPPVEDRGQPASGQSPARCNATASSRSV